MPPSTAAANNAATMLGTSTRRSAGLRRLRDIETPFERETNAALPRRTHERVCRACHYENVDRSAYSHPIWQLFTRKSCTSCKVVATGPLGDENARHRRRSCFGVNSVKVTARAETGTPYARSTVERYASLEAHLIGNPWVQLVTITVATSFLFRLS